MDKCAQDFESSLFNKLEEIVRIQCLSRTFGGRLQMSCQRAFKLYSVTLKQDVGFSLVVAEVWSIVPIKSSS